MGGMEHWASDAMAWLKAHQTLAGPALFLLATVESLAVVGAFAPLTAMLLMVGAAMGGGVFSPIILLWIIAGCALGNAISFEGGAWSRRRGLGTAWIPQKARDGAERLFERYGPAAVIVGRFMGLTASVVPFLAGWSGMERRRFWPANSLMCLVWPPTMTAFGYFGVKAFVH